MQRVLSRDVVESVRPREHFAAGYGDYHKIGGIFQRIQLISSQEYSFASLFLCEIFKFLIEIICDM